VFCNSKVFNANCNKNKADCFKNSYINLNLKETCPENMIFAGRIGLRKFFTLKDFIVVKKESLPGDNYKNCFETAEG
jgi:hypothetical protein